MGNVTRRKRENKTKQNEGVVKKNVKEMKQEKEERRRLTLVGKL